MSGCEIKLEKCAGVAGCGYKLVEWDSLYCAECVCQVVANHVAA